MQIKTEKGYIFLPKPLTSKQYYLLNDYTELKYINSYTIGLEEKLTHFENCQIFFEIVSCNSLEKIKKENPNLDYGDIIDLTLKKEKGIFAFEMAKSFPSVNIYLPSNIDDITIEQWKHFLSYYSKKQLENYVEVLLSHKPKEFINFDTTKTETNKKVIQLISEKKRIK